MKTIFSLLVSAALAAGVQADGASFSTWTDKDGREARMRLIEVIEGEDGLSGRFALENGGVVTVSASMLSDEDAKRLADGVVADSVVADSVVADSVVADGVVADGAGEDAPESIFDRILDRRLVILNDRRFDRYELENKPTKFYVFYYTASWCPPCREYTPSLVEFYNQTRDSTDRYELILISSDHGRADMLRYAREHNMRWPHVDLRYASSISNRLGHDVLGIPSVIVTDLEGNVVTRTTSIHALRQTLLD